MSSIYRSMGPMRKHAPAKAGILLAIAAAAGCAGIVSNLDTTPTNDLPNPYRSSPFGNLPAGHSKWGALNGVAVEAAKTRDMIASRVIYILSPT